MPTPVKPRVLPHVFQVGENGIFRTAAEFEAWDEDYRYMYNVSGQSIQIMELNTQYTSFPGDVTLVHRGTKIQGTTGLLVLFSTELMFTPKDLALINQLTPLHVFQVATGQSSASQNIITVGATRVMRILYVVIILHASGTAGNREVYMVVNPQALLSATDVLLSVPLCDTGVDANVGVDASGVGGPSAFILGTAPKAKYNQWGSVVELGPSDVVTVIATLQVGDTYDYYVVAEVTTVT